MPNWVKIQVIAEDFNKLKKYLVRRGKVDFNKLFPLPDDLKISSGSDSYEYNLSADENIKNRYFNINILLKDILRPDMCQNEFIDRALESKDVLNEIEVVKNRPTLDARTANTFLRGYYNYHKYGQADWYKYCLTMWGCKWNASETHIDKDKQIIEFETPWSIPERIFLELAKHVNIRVLYADEDIGSNCGLIDFYKSNTGEVSCQVVMDDSVELAQYVWGYEHPDVYDDNGNIITDEKDKRVIKATKALVDTAKRLSNAMTVEDLKDSVKCWNNRL